MKIALPDKAGVLHDYRLSGVPIAPVRLGPDPARIIFAAAHVVADPFAANDPSGPACGRQAEHPPCRLTPAFPGRRAGATELPQVSS